MITCTKLITDIPFAHRQHTHQGHCAFIHGHNWAFELTFSAHQLDECGFVIDFGGLVMRGLKDWINRHFDHKLVLNESDPWLTVIMAQLLDVTHAGNGPVNLADILVVPDCSCEGLARYLFVEINSLVRNGTDDRVCLSYIRVIEDSKNWATYQP